MCLEIHLAGWKLTRGKGALRGCYEICNSSEPVVYTTTVLSKITECTEKNRLNAIYTLHSCTVRKSMKHLTQAFPTRQPKQKGKESEGYSLCQESSCQKKSWRQVHVSKSIAEVGVSRQETIRMHPRRVDVIQSMDEMRSQSRGPAGMAGMAEIIFYQNKQAT